MSATTDLLFLRNLQRLLAEGQFTATYKFALLQALADLAVERDADANGGLRLPVPDIAEKFIHYYWRQAVPFRPSPAAGTDAGAILRQNTDAQAAIIGLVIAARRRANGKLGAALADEVHWRRLRRQVAGIVRQMPLWKLQTVAGHADEFLYRKDEYRDGAIRLLPGVPQALRNFHGFVTQLIRGAWVTQVSRISANRALLGDTGDLSIFLFGSGRAALADYRDVLRLHQASKCFYCGRRVTRGGDLDHFIAWSRYPVDLGHNFVFSHPECNRAKGDYLAAARHLGRWRQQNLDDAARLDKSFADAKLPHDQCRSRQVAVWAYEQGQVSGAHAWLRGRLFEKLGSGWRREIE